jgi:hypothetical protein
VNVTHGRYKGLWRETAKKFGRDRETAGAGRGHRCRDGNPIFKGSAGGVGWGGIGSEAAGSEPELRGLTDFDRRPLPGPVDEGSRSGLGSVDSALSRVRIPRRKRAGC